MNCVTVFVNECLNWGDYTQIMEILTEKFIKVNVTNFSVFSNLKLETMYNLEDYFQKEMHIIRKLGII